MRLIGSPKHGGRQKGAKNRMTKENKALVDKARAAGLTPLEYMLSIMRNTEEASERRDWAASECAPYMHPKLQAIAYDDGKPPESKGEINVIALARAVALMMRAAIAEDVQPRVIAK